MPFTMRSLSKLRDDKTGSSVVEFGLVLPVVVLLCTTAVDAGQQILRSQRLNATAAQVADLVAKEQSPSRSKIDDILRSVPYVMGRTRFDQDGVVVVSAVTRSGSAAAKVAWQVRGAGTLTQASQVGAVGAAATLPADFTVADGQPVLAVEVFFRYARASSPQETDKVMARRSYFVARTKGSSTLSSS